MSYFFFEKKSFSSDLFLHLNQILFVFLPHLLNRLLKFLVLLQKGNILTVFFAHLIVELLNRLIELLYLCLNIHYFTEVSLFSSITATL